MLKDYPKPPFPKQPQSTNPGQTAPMDPPPDHGETSYVGSGKLTGKAAVITGGDSGIGRAVAIAFAREGADVMVAYAPSERADAETTAELVGQAGRKAVLFAGDLADRAAGPQLVAKAVEAFGRIDVLVNNAAYQMARESILDIADDEWDRTFDVNIGGIFRVTKAALPHMPPGSSVICTASVNADQPPPMLLAYNATKAAIQNFCGSLAQQLGDKGIRVNVVAPGPVWTPLIPATMPADQVSMFGQSYPMKRPAQPAELAAAYVLLASDEASYISGATVAVTGGKPVI